MAKILKHFGLGNKKSNTSPAHKCKLETDSPKVPRASADKSKETKDDGSNSSSSPLSPVKLPFNSGEPSTICDFKQNSKAFDNNKQAHKEVVNDEDVPVYSAVIKDKITPDSILNEITSKLNVSDEKSTPESLSTFGKIPSKVGCLLSMNFKNSLVCALFKKFFKSNYVPTFAQICHISLFL